MSPPLPKFYVSPPSTNQHPEDQAAEDEGRRNGIEFGTAALRDVPGLDEQLRQLLTTYADTDAESHLLKLREWFWVEALPDAVKRAKRGA